MARIERGFARHRQVQQRGAEAIGLLVRREAVEHRHSLHRIECSHLHRDRLGQATKRDAGIGFGR